jgi:hypothetical protein
MLVISSGVFISFVPITLLSIKAFVGVATESNIGKPSSLDVKFIVVMTLA